MKLMTGRPVRLSLMKGQVANQKGIALVTTMILMLVSLAIVMAALYLITQQTQLSAASRTYRSVLAAAHGGGPNLFAGSVLPLIYSSYSTSFIESKFSGVSLSMANVKDEVCIKQKLHQNTSTWTACSANSKNTDPLISPDVTLALKGPDINNPFITNIKIVDTQMGNSDTSRSGAASEFDSAGAVTMGNSPGINPVHTPSIYRIEVQAQNKVNPREKANLTVVYAY